MIDRTTPVLLLRPKVLLGAVGISGVLFSLLPACSLLLIIGGIVGYAVCWAAYIFIFILGYGLAFSVAAALPVGSIVLARRRKTPGGFQVGCMFVVAGIISLVISVVSFPIVTAFLMLPQTLLIGIGSTYSNDAFVGFDDVIFATCISLSSLIFETFLTFQVYFYAWSVAALALSLAMLTLVALGVVSLESSVKQVFQRIRRRCKKCGSTTTKFRCPGQGCNVWHEDLRPSIYGVLSVSCAKCETRCPTTDWTGRRKLAQACANEKCGGASDEDAGQLSEYHLAIVGAQSSGKSCFLFATVWRFLDFAFANGMQVTFPDPLQKKEFDQNIAGFKRGAKIDKTPSRERPLALTLDMTSRSGVRSRVYFYDAAGEDYEAGDLASDSYGLSGFDFFNYLDGILLIVDPLAEERAVASQPENNPARHESSYLLARVLPSLERAQDISSGNQIPIPVAVVVTKADAALHSTPGLQQESDRNIPLLDQLFGSELSGWVTSMKEAESIAMSNSQFVREFLQRIGAGDVVQLLESSFFTVGYFGVSSLGRLESQDSSTELKPERILEPTIWLCCQSQALSDHFLSTRMWQNATDFFRRSLRGSEGGWLQASSWGVVLAMVTLWGGLCWYIGGPILAVVGVLAITAGYVTVRRLQTNGLQDLASIANGAAQFGEWFLDSIRGKRTRNDSIKAIGITVAILATLAGVATFLWTLLASA